mmetsp:Transcript_33222/g.59494  ORF Transcript_33222/g.59494 Transcript_33222/m.59494 type:complete len:202 (-) Transcript_33222:324-929(-)
MVDGQPYFAPIGGTYCGHTYLPTKFLLLAWAHSYPCRHLEDAQCGVQCLLLASHAQERSCFHFCEPAAVSSNPLVLVGGWARNGETVPYLPENNGAFVSAMSGRVPCLTSCFIVVRARCAHRHIMVSTCTVRRVPCCSPTLVSPQKGFVAFVPQVQPPFSAYQQNASVQWVEWFSRVCIVPPQHMDHAHQRLLSRSLCAVG